MRDNCLPDLLRGRREEVTDSLWNLIPLGVKWAGIGITYPTHTATANFEMSEHCCEVLNASLLNGDALDIKEHSNHIRD